MDNNEIKAQLRYRANRIKDLLAIQTEPDASYLLKTELTYVEAQIEYRERHGGMEGIILPKA